MPTLTYKILGQVAPLATTETLLYTVPAVTQTVISSVTVTNRGSSATTFRVSVSAGGAATATKDYLYFDVSIPANDTFIATVGITMGTTDVVRVYGGNANLSCAVWGSEIT